MLNACLLCSLERVNLLVENTSLLHFVTSFRNRDFEVRFKNGLAPNLAGRSSLYTLFYFWHNFYHFHPIEFFYTSKCNRLCIPLLTLLGVLPSTYRLSGGAFIGTVPSRQSSREEMHEQPDWRKIKDQKVFSQDLSVIRDQLPILTSYITLFLHASSRVPMPSRSSKLSWMSWAWICENGFKYPQRSKIISVQTTSHY